MPRGRSGGLFYIGLLVLLAGGPRAAFAQEAQVAGPAATVVAPDAETLERIHQAASAPRLGTVGDSLRFYALVQVKPSAFADFSKGWDFSITPIASPTATRGFGGGGFGLDVLSLIHSAVQAYRERQSRLVREQIERELRALAGS